MMSRGIAFLILTAFVRSHDPESPAGVGAARNRTTGRSDMLPFSEACERNKEPILAVLREVFADASGVLEVGSGTGQHAVHFARHLPWLTWQPTDRRDHLAMLAARIREEGPVNLLEPIELDVLSPGPLHAASTDAVFSANTLHIMSWEAVEALFGLVGRMLPATGVLALYGPFRYAGRFTSDSNAEFDAWLRDRDPDSGIRDAEDVDRLALAQGLTLTADHAMPANNQLRVWRR
jgi:cyclopropane fatty-acyl-phospholipid synthase-like methyltransferase